MILTRSFAGVPQRPGLYAMHGGEQPRTWVAYVGIAGGIAGRLVQHFYYQNSSVVTRTSAVGVNIKYVTFVDWWEHPLLEDETQRHAAELIAFRILDPALRSRGNPRRAATALLEDHDFVTNIEALLKAEPSGRFLPPRLSSLAEEVESLRSRIEQLEQRIPPQ